MIDEVQRLKRFKAAVLDEAEARVQEILEEARAESESISADADSRAGKELRDHTTLVRAFNETDARLDVFTLNYHGDKNPDTALETIPLKENIHVHYTDGRLIPLELAKEADRATCVVICSYATNYTVGLTTLVEAMALGLPIICSRNAQMPFDVEKEGCGITVG